MHNISIKPKLAIRKNLSKYLEKIDKNRYYSNFGPLYEFTRKKIKKDYNLKKNDVILTSSGHSSVLACCNYLKSINTKKIIVTTSFNFFSAPQAILQSGFEPYFVDIELSSFSINFDDLEQAIKIYKKNLAGILIPSPFGYPINIKKLNLIQKKYNINVIYDAADTFINFDKSLDKSNIMICCSFHPTKTLPSNESGLIICPKKRYEHLKSIISFGYSGINREASFVGFNGKFTEYDAAIFLANYNERKFIKKKIFKDLNFFYSYIKNLNIKNFVLQKNFGKTWISTKMCFYSKNKSISLLKKIFQKFGIEIYSPWNKKPMHLHKIFKQYKKGKMDNTLKLYNHFFTIPFNIDIKKLEIKKIINILKGIN